MTTHDVRAPGAGGEVPLSPADLALLATQIYAELTPLQVSTPAPPTAPFAPAGRPRRRRSRTRQRARSNPGPGTPPGVWTEPSLLGQVVPGPDTPPYTVPVAPRGSAPGPALAPPVSAYGPPLGALTPIAPGYGVPVFPVQAPSAAPFGIAAPPQPPSVPLAPGGVPGIPGLAGCYRPGRALRQARERWVGLRERWVGLRERVWSGNPSTRLRDRCR